jgi:hypothetical protein
MSYSTWTVNGLNAYELLTSQGTTYRLAYITEDSTLTIYFGIRVWKRSSSGTETEITSGTAVAIASGLGSGLISGTWSCPSTSLDGTDSIVVRVYAGTSSPPTTLLATFTTEQLGAQSLDAATWTVYYYLSKVSLGGGHYEYDFYWGTTTYNSRIENFTWTPVPVPVVVKKPIMKIDLGPHPRSRLLFAPTLMLKSVGAPPAPTLWDSWDYLWVAVL